MSQDDALSSAILDTLTANFEVPEGITPDTEFENLDLDSLVLVELSVQLTKKFGVEVLDDELISAGTVAKTAELIAAKSSRG